MSDVRNDAKMALARYESSYAAFGAEACFTLKGLRDVQRYIEKLEAALREIEGKLNVLRDNIIDDYEPKYPYTIRYAQNTERCAKIARKALEGKDD